MTITEAKEKCEELQKQITIIQEKYIMADGYAKYCGEQEIKPFYNEWNKLQTLICKAEDETEI